MSEDINSLPAAPGDYRIMLPCAPEDFAAFVSSLLGKPQTISGWIGGHFEIKRNDIENIYYLLTQRVSQQNQGQLVQFSIEILYDDDTKVALNSFFDLNHYAEIQKKNSIAANLTFVFVIQFADRKYPEKQQIDITFRSNRAKGQSSREDIVLDMTEKLGFEYQIKHTARTWGVDIESLLQNHLTSLRVVPPRWQQALRPVAGLISGITGWTIVLGAMASVYIFYQRYIESIKQKIEGISPKISVDGLNAKLDYLLVYINSADGVFFYAAALTYVLILSAIAIFIAINLKSIIVRSPPNALLLTDRAKEVYDRQRNLQKHGWIKILGGALGSIVFGVLANYIFAYLSS